MNRRTILKSIVAAPAAAALQAQTPAKEPGRVVEESPKVETAVPDSSADPVVRFFTREQFAALTHLSEVLEPATSDTPGAREARAPEFLDFLLGQSPAPRQTLYRVGLDLLNSESAHRYSRPFAALDAEQAAVVISPLRRPWTYEDPSDPLEHFLREAKADILYATRNSYEFISVVSKRNRGASGVGEFWYPLY
jgi:Gluconate 2-dehydrogenase subunit 3